MHDLNNGSDVGVMNIKKLGPAYAPPLTLSYNPAEQAILVNEVGRQLPLALYFLANSPPRAF